MVELEYSGEQMAKGNTVTQNCNEIKSCHLKKRLVRNMFESEMEKIKMN